MKNAETVHLPSIKRKPRVLIIPNTVSWIIGDMAVQIVNRFGEDYDFWFITDKVIQLRPDLVRALAPTLDFVFPLADTSYQLLKRAIHPLVLPSIFWVHHVVSWNASMADAVADASELIACTEDWKARIQEQSPAEKEITVVRHGVDTQLFRRRPSVRSRLGMPEDGFVIGFVGSKRSAQDGGRKGLDTLEAVLNQFNEEVSNLHVSFLGLGWDAEVERLRAKGISSNYVGFVSQQDLPSFYSSIDTYLMTSRIEGGPCTILEAMACQTPVVGTRVGLVPKTVIDGVNGFSTEIDDVSGLCSALRTLAGNAPLRATIGNAARQTIESGLDWRKTLNTLEQPLKRMSHRSPRLQRATGSDVRLTREFHSAVHALDGFLSSIGSLRRGLTGPLLSARMLAACLQECSPSDLLRGVGLATRLCFRPSSVRSSA